MGVFAKFREKYLPNAAWWTGDFELSSQGVALLFVSPPFHQLGCQSQPLLVLLTKPPQESSLLLLCPSGFVPSPVSCTHRLLQREISSGSGCELYVGSLCSQSNLLQKIGGGLFFFFHWIQWECVKVKKSPHNLNFSISSSKFCVFFCSSSLPQGKTWITSMAYIQYLEKWQKAWMYWRQSMKPL